MQKSLLIFLFSLIALMGTPLPAKGQGAAAKNLVGKWQSQVATPWGLGIAETILMPNGRFSKTFRVGEMKILDTGTYTVGDGYIHFDIQDHEPKVYKGKPMHWIKSETVFFKMIDPNRMACEDRITGGRWEAFRVR